MLHHSYQLVFVCLSIFAAAVSPKHISSQHKKKKKKKKKKKNSSRFSAGRLIGCDSKTSGWGKIGFLARVTKGRANPQTDFVNFL
ncbi:hypothetical protein HanIR_Chr01g0037501 [Helianthus annuus]|nr:hypothetical protein HanIR_Chr01g0037501 [Helianthus annuus]